MSGRFRHGDVGYASLWVADEAKGRRFFAAVLGWPETGIRQAEAPGVHHGLAGGVPSPTLFVNYGVDDLDGALGRVRAAGGAHHEPGSEPWGLNAMCVDPEGLRFALYQLGPEDQRGPRPGGEHHGDLWYITMEVADSSVARAFYGSVLGWSFEPGRVHDGWEPVDAAPMTGLRGGAPHPSIVAMYRVDEIGATLELVRRAGGTATAAQQETYGSQAACTDDQGTAFYLGQPATHA